MRTATTLLLSLTLPLLVAGPLLSQAAPATQPKRLMIYVEHVKPGMDNEHARHEAGWVAANAAANSPAYTRALVSMTGPSQVWWLSAWDSYADEGQQMKWEEANPQLGAETARLWRRDAEYLERVDAIEAIGRPDLSVGTMPDIDGVRFQSVATFRIRPGHEQAWEAAARVYMENYKRANPGGSLRVYQVVNGLPGSNYLGFSSVNAYADLDKDMAIDQAVWTGMSPKDRAIMQKTSTEDILVVTSNRYRVSPSMSYVSAATRAKDPAFWGKQ